VIVGEFGNIAKDCFDLLSKGEKIQGILEVMFDEKRGNWGGRGGLNLMQFWWPLPIRPTPLWRLGSMIRGKHVYVQKPLTTLQFTNPDL